MTNLHVNLLKPDELRYQGVVSREFAVRVSLWGGGALLLVLALIGLVNARLTHRQLATTREAWTAIEPRFARVQSLQGQLVKSRAVQGDLEGWASSRVLWHEHMGRLQGLVPPEVQLTELSVRNEWEVIVEGDKDKEKQIPARRFQLRIEGRTSGERADEVVVQFVDRMRASTTLAESLESLSLQGLQRSSGHQEEDGTRMFGIEGVSYLRRME